MRFILEQPAKFEARLEANFERANERFVQAEKRLEQRMTKAADERFKRSEARLSRLEENLNRLEWSLALPQATLSDFVDARRAERRVNGRRRLRKD